MYTFPATQKDERFPARRAAEVEGPSAMGWVHCLSLRIVQMLLHPWPIAQVNTQGLATGVCFVQVSKGSCRSHLQTQWGSQEACPALCSWQSLPHCLSTHAWVLLGTRQGCTSHSKHIGCSPEQSPDTARICPLIHTNYTDTVRGLE